MIVKIHDICGGKPTIKGTRMPVSTILAHLMEGSSIKEIVEAFPWITENDVKDCLQYAIELCS